MRCLPIHRCVHHLEQADRVDGDYWQSLHGIGKNKIYWHLENLLLYANMLNDHIFKWQIKSAVLNVFLSTVESNRCHILHNQCVSKNDNKTNGIFFSKCCDLHTIAANAAYFFVVCINFSGFVQHLLFTRHIVSPGLICIYARCLSKRLTFSLIDFVFMNDLEISTATKQPFRKAFPKIKSVKRRF